MPTTKPDSTFSLNERAAGILLHITSLPGPYGAGDLGAGARAFADFLAASGQRWWQMLPVSPAGAGHSPYSGSSAFAGDPMLIDLDDLVARGLLEGHALEALPEERSDFERAREVRRAALHVATRALGRGAAGLAAFRTRERSWLGDYALFMALHDRHGGAAWTEWDRGLATRQPAALEQARRDLAQEILHYELEQLLFDEQWRSLRAYCKERGVGLIGDIPIFVAHDSADVWANRSLFRLDETGQPTHVAGVPPDYFSKTGQRWGNPLYRWKALKRSHYAWWIDRFRKLLGRFDVIRLDHFIGFVRYWEVPASEATAEHGRYLKGPGADLFEATRRALGSVPFIAEDLGSVTPAVLALRDQFELPGMRVLQFAFGGDAQAEAFLPHAYTPRSVAYTGTHDNDTIVGWFEGEGAGPGNPRSLAQAAKEREAAIDYVAGPGASHLAGPVHWEMMRALYASVARTTIIPMQDVLGLGNDARMNSPGAANGNWEWRLPRNAASADLAARLRALAITYGRTPARRG